MSDSQLPCSRGAGKAILPTLRMGFRYAKGLREETAQAIVRERSKRPFESIADLAHRVPELRRNELVLLASIGALNSIGCANAEDVPAHLDRPHKKQRLHRRDALWQVERAARFAGPSAGRHSGDRYRFAAAAHDAGGATGCRLPRHRAHGRTASYGVPPG